MKKGISIWSLTSREPDEFFSLAKECGYDGVEVGIGNSGPLRLDSSEKELTELKKKADEYGMPLYSLVYDFCWHNPLSASDPDVRQKGEQNVIRELEIASILGCDTLLVIPGMVKNPGEPNSEIVPYDVAYDRAFEAVCRLSEHAEKYGVNMALENVGNKLLLSPLEMRDFIDKVGSPKVKAYFDVGNVMRTGYAEHWIDILGDRIAKVHFKDSRMEAGGALVSTDILDGETNYPAVMKSLRAIGYDDWVTAEIFPKGDRDRKEFLTTNALAMDKIIKEM